MKAHISAMLVVALIMPTCRAQASACQLVSGFEWVNELGSVMKLNVDQHGNLSGTYTSAVGCGAGKPRSLIGTCNGYAVAFTVNWEECVSTTAWSGTIDTSGDEQRINTLWHLTLAKQPGWDSIVSGADRFSPK